MINDIIDLQLHIVSSKSKNSESYLYKIGMISLVLMAELFPQSYQDKAFLCHYNYIHLVATTVWVALIITNPDTLVKTACEQAWKRKPLRVLIIKNPAIFFLMEKARRKKNLLKQFLSPHEWSQSISVYLPLRPSEFSEDIFSCWEYTSVV